VAKIAYVSSNGDERVIEVASGLSVMEGAVNNNVRGIIAECHGALSCATCHVYVDPSWVNRLGEKSETETAMLDCVCDPQPNSRLACQIKVTEALDGLIVHIPEKQI
jgi:ferredoxin, 2Fe-2S